MEQRRTKNLILLAYGNPVEYRRAIFCIMSFWAWYSGDKSEVRVTVYTDDPDFFSGYLAKLPVNYFMLTTDLLREMLDGKTYIHRRKVAVIAETFSDYPEDDLVFVDSDAFFVRDPAPMFDLLKPGVSLMHTREYTFQEGAELFASFGQGEPPAAFIRFLESKPLTITGKERQFSRKDSCWNSGVLGLTREVSAYMPDVFRITDDFFANSGWFISEQLAFTLVLEEETNVLPAEIYVFHYWGKRQKALMDKILQSYISTMVSVDDEHQQKLTGKWARSIENDMIKEQAVLGLYTKNWLYGIKKTIIAILKNPANISIFKELSEMNKKVS